MTLVKTFPTPVKASPTTKLTASSPTGKSPSIIKKPVDVNSSLKNPSVPASSVKTKTTSILAKSPSKAEKSPSKGEKSLSKLTGTKPSINSTIKTVPLTTPTTMKSSVTKSAVAEPKTPVRNIIKPLTTLKTPEQKPLGLKKAIPVHLPEKPSSSKTSVNSASAVLKTPTKSNTLVKNNLLSPIKSVSSPIKSISSPNKSVSSSIKSISSPIKSVSPSIKSTSTTIKSVSTPIKSISAPLKSAPLSIKSISSPIKSASSPIKSVSPPIKSASSPIKSISSPLRSLSSPLKSKTTNEVKPSSSEKTKDVKTNQIVSGTSIRKSTSILKSPLKSISSPPNKVESISKSKLSIKNSPSSKIVKNTSATTKTVSQQQTIAETNTADVSSSLSGLVEEVNVCHCIDTIENCQEFTNTPLITEYTIDNSDNFDVVQAFKVAKQLIQIQSNDRNLETIIETCENNSMVNWDDVITPCDEIITIHNSDNQNELVHSQKDDNSISRSNSKEPKATHDSCIIEIPGFNYSCDSEMLNLKSNYEQNDKFVVSVNRDENQNIIEFRDTADPFSFCHESTEIETKDKKYFTDELSFANTGDSTMQNHCNKNEFPEWTITIDEFSPSLDKKESQPPSNCEIVAEKESCSANLSYADVLKKIPDVLVNSTNLKSHRKEPKLKVNAQIKEYETSKKVDPILSTNLLINDIENNYQDYEYNDFYEEPDYVEMRKKKCKKIKHLPKRHLRNINREYECIENHTDVFVISVWKNIY